MGGCRNPADVKGAARPSGPGRTTRWHQVPPDGRLPQPRRCEGRRRVRRARAGFEIDHSERSSRVAISRAAGPEGARNTSGAHQVPPDWRPPRGLQGLAGLRGEAPPHTAPQAPPVWRASEGPEGQAAVPVGGGRGLAGLRGDAPSEARGADGERAGRPRGGRRSGGRARRCPKHQRAKRPLFSANAGFWASRVVDEARHVALEEGGDGRGRARAVLGDDDVGFAGAVFLVVVVGAV